MSLSGKTVVVTRGETGGSEWEAALTARGAFVYDLPTIATAPIEPNEELTAVMASLADYDWIVFTSANGVRYFLRLAGRLGYQPAELALPAIAAIGRRTAAEAAANSLKVAFMPAVSNGRQLAAGFPDSAGKRLLLLRTAIASDELPAALRQAGAEVADVRIYRTQTLTTPDADYSRLLRAGSIDFLTFASPSAVKGFIARNSPTDLAQAVHIPAAAIGTSVARSLAAAGFMDVHSAHQPTIDAVVHMLEELASRQTRLP